MAHHDFRQPGKPGLNHRALSALLDTAHCPPGGPAYVVGPSRNGPVLRRPPRRAE